MFRAFVIGLCLCFGIPSVAQVTTGVYQFGAFDNHGFDTTNVGSLNVHFAIPILNKAGRGSLPLSYNLSYDSSVWYPAQIVGAKAWTPVPNFGWGSGSMPLFGYVTDSSIAATDAYGCSWESFGGFTYYDAAQVSHPFNVGVWVQLSPAAPNAPYYEICPSSTGPQSGTASDGSGYQITVSADGSQATVTSPSLSITATPVQSTFAVTNGQAPSVPPIPGTLTDTNGNQISVDGNGNFTDTTGHVALQVVGAAPSPQTLTYKDTNGNSQTATVNYTPYTVQTAFGCSGVGEYGPVSNYLVSSIVLVDRSTYNFTYESTPGVSNAVTGRLASVTLPGGGVIGYTYTGSNNGIVCNDGSAAGLTRTMLSDSPNTSWTYSRTPNVMGRSSHSNVVDGLGNNYDYDFIQPFVIPSFYEVNRDLWNGTMTGPHALSRQTCYNASGSTCLNTAIQPPITQVDTYQILTDSEETGTTTKYNSSGLPTEVDTYDYGPFTNNNTDSRGVKLSIETFGYGACGPATIVSSDTLMDSSSNILFKTTYCYDETIPSTSSGVPSHVAVSGARENLTTQTVYASSSANRTTTFTYEDTGSVLTSVDSINGTTSYSYDSTFTYPTGSTLPTPSSGVTMTTGASFDTTNTGVPVSTTDSNNKQTQYSSYDSLLRPTEVDYPDGGKTTYAYTPTDISTHSYQTGSAYVDQETQLDGYGRVVRSAVKNATGQFYQQDTCYDGNGNVSFRSYSYAGTGPGSSRACSGAGDSYTYDALNRVRSLSHGDGSGTSVQHSYSGRAIQVTDENGVSHISQVDGFGRRTTICEVTSVTISGQSPAACGTDISGTGFLTTYAYGYSSGNPMITVTQGTQTRIFQTDWIGRPVSSSEPERGLTSYAYSSNGTGAVVTRTRPQANQTNASVLTTTTTQYDTLGRPLSIVYADANTSFAGYRSTPQRNYSYDVSPNWSGDTAKTNLKGRLSLEGVGPSAPAAYTNYSYDAMGRVLHITTCRPSNCGVGTDGLDYTYDLAGNILTSTDGNNITSTYTYSPVNTPSSLTSSQGSTTLVSVSSQGPFGDIYSTLGNGVITNNGYDSMGRLNGRVACGSLRRSECFDRIDGVAVTWQGRRAVSGRDLMTSIDYTYGYDDFNRLQSIIANGSETYNFSYDRWGNRLSETPGPVLSTDGSNHLLGFAYDAAGNMLNDASGNSYTYDAEGNVLQVTGNAAGTILYTYDALNRRVRVDEGSSFREYDFNPAGQRVSIWNSSTNNIQGEYYWENMPIAYYTGSTIHYQHQDWLGNVRVRTTSGEAVEGTFTQQPFGDGSQITYGTDTDDAHFASLDSDSATQTSHGQFRELATTYGRWMSPDPYDGSYNLADPQTLNRYPYVGNNPLTMVDPLGLNWTCITSTTTWDGVHNGIASQDTSTDIECGYDPGGGGSASGDGDGSDAEQTGPAPNKLTPDQCAAMTTVLAREAKYGTRIASYQSAVLFAGLPGADGALAPFDSGSVGHNANIGGKQFDTEWFAVLSATTPGLVAPASYIVGKTIWSLGRKALGIPVTNALPFQDPGERTAVWDAFLYKDYKDIFTPAVMAQCK